MFPLRTTPVNGFRMQLQLLSIIALNMNDLPARIDPAEAAIGRPTPTAHRLDGVVRAIRMLRTAPEPDPGDRVVRLSAQMIGLRFTARGAGRRAALVAASPRPRGALVTATAVGAAVTTTVSVTLPIGPQPTRKSIRGCRATARRPRPHQAESLACISARIWPRGSSAGCRRTLPTCPRPMVGRQPDHAPHVSLSLRCGCSADV